MTASKWGVHSLKNFVEAHVSDYESSFDALYEYTKNLEEAKAKNIYIEFLMDRRTILVYGDGEGLDATKLNEMRLGIGKSSKGITHHGLGILAFMRFAQKMVVFSRKAGKMYVLSCMGENDEIVSDVGDAREAGDEEKEYAPFYNKLRKLWDGDGTITILEGVGRYKSERYSQIWEMKEEFEAKKFIKWFQLKCGFSLMDHNYFLKKDENTKLARIPEKMGHGAKLDFTIPSAEHPANKIGGQKKNVFEHLGRLFELRVRFLFWVSNSNEGEIRISEDRQNSILVKDAIKYKIDYKSVYKNPEYTKYLTGSIDFKIKPLDGGESLNVYSGTRSSLIMDGGFGDCLCNIMYYAAEEVIKPKLEEFIRASQDRKSDRRSLDLQKDIQMFFRDNPDIFNDLVTTRSQGPVQYATVKCRKCETSVIPKRGGKSADLVTQKNNIYAPDDVSIYICGTCGNRWDRRSYEKTENTQPYNKPLYERPEPGQGSIRQKRRGCGYTMLVCDLAKDDPRRASFVNDVVRVNRKHMDYQQVAAEKNARMLWLYERHVAFSAILDHELAEASRAEYAKKEQTIHTRLFTWALKRDGRVSMKDVEAAIEEDEKKEDTKETAQALGARWGAKVKVDPKK